MFRFVCALLPKAFPLFFFLNIQEPILFENNFSNAEVNKYIEDSS